MTIGNTPKRAKRAYAAPRRRFRTDDDAGYLGDAPILLNLPNLCGVPDLDDADDEAAEGAEGAEAETGVADAPSAGLATDSAIASLLSAGKDSEAMPSSDVNEGSEEECSEEECNEEEADRSEEKACEKKACGERACGKRACEKKASDAEMLAGEEDAAGDATTQRDEARGKTRLAAPEYTASGDDGSATEQDADDASEGEYDQYQDEDDYDDDYEEGYSDDAASTGPGIHRKIITWTAIFVAVASLYMYVNRDKAHPVATPTDQPDVELGWEDDPFTNDGFGTEAPLLEPAYGEPFDVPPLDPAQDPAQASAVVPDASAGSAGDRLPGAATQADSDFPMYRVGSQAEDNGYPETTTPEAAYEISNNPTDIRTSMRPDAAGPTSSLDGISPMTPTAGAANDQPY